MITIKYINNTCDVNGISEYGEHLIAIYDGQVVFHHDYSDSVIDIEDSISAHKEISKKIKVKTDDLKFKCYDDGKVPIEIKKVVNQYLKENT